MREVRNYRHYFAVGNREYEDTSIWNDLRYCEPREDECFELNTFAEAVEAIKRGAIHRAEIDYTFFGKKPMIVLRKADLYCDRVVLTEKTFKPIRVKYAWEVHNRRVTMDTLSDQLSADEFCEYLKDRGIFQISVK